MEADRRSEARRWALRALARSMRTRREVRDGLLARGFASPEADAVVGEFEERGWLDDRRLAERWVEVRSSSRGLGRHRIAAELARRGVPGEVAAQALAAGLPPEAEAAAAVAAARRRGRVLRGTGPQARAALYRYLRGRGFSAEAIRRALGADAEPREED